MDKERELIAVCRVKIEQILNWGDSSMWTNSDFELLSDKIFAKTQVRLSISTLKRIWGKVKYDNSPTAATLNALASFIGHNSWRDFESEESVTQVKAEVPKAEPAAALAVSRPRRKLVQVFTMIALVVVSTLVLLVLVKGKTRQKFDSSLASFTHRQVTDDLPNSVIFDYDASAYDADSVFIQQNWDPTRRQKVARDGKQHTSVYYLPGYFLAKLVVNDQIVKEDVVYIETKGWKGVIEGGNPPIYLNADDFMKDGKMKITPDLIKEKIGTPVFNKQGVTLTNVRDFNVYDNDFRFEAMLRNASTPEESVCRRVSVCLLTTDGAIIVPLSTKGCISEIGLMTGQGWISGKENDLSAFGCDFATTEKIELQAHDSTFYVRLNDKEIFSEKQKGPSRKIVGVRITFEGAGEIDYVKLNDEVIN